MRAALDCKDAIRWLLLVDNTDALRSREFGETHLRDTRRGSVLKTTRDKVLKLAQVPHPDWAMLLP